MQGWSGGRGWAGRRRAPKLEGAPLKSRARRAPQPSRWPKLGDLSALYVLNWSMVARSENGEAGGGQLHLHVSNNDDSLVRPIIANGGSKVHFCETDKTTLV